MLKDTNGLGSRVIVLKDDTRRPQGVYSGPPFEPDELDMYDTIVVRGCGVERINLRTLVEMGESVFDSTKVRQRCCPSDT